MAIRGAFLIAFLAASLANPALADEGKVLRLALPDVAILDPQQITDLYSARAGEPDPAARHLWAWHGFTLEIAVRPRGRPRAPRSLRLKGSRR